MHHAFKLGSSEHNLELSRSATGYRLHLQDRIVEVRLEPGENGIDTLTVDGKAYRIVIATRGDDVFVHLGGEAYALHYEHPLERLAHQAQAGTGDDVRAPMPGSLVNVAVKPGQAVTRGETLLVMESMKMETTVAAPRDGVVKAIHYGTAQPFERDAVLLSLEPALSPDPSPASGRGEISATPSSSPRPLAGEGPGERGRP